MFIVFSGFIVHKIPIPFEEHMMSLWWGIPLTGINLLRASWQGVWPWFARGLACVFFFRVQCNNLNPRSLLAKSSCRVPGINFRVASQTLVVRSQYVCMSMAKTLHWIKSQYWCTQKGESWTQTKPPILNVCMTVKFRCRFKITWSWKWAEQKHPTWILFFFFVALEECGQLLTAPI